jgi:hypothetical protein
VINRREMVVGTWQAFLLGIGAALLPKDANAHAVARGRISCETWLLDTGRANMDAATYKAAKHLIGGAFG